MGTPNDEKPPALTSPSQWEGFSGRFVARPVATFLLAVGLSLLGVVAFFLLPVAPLPRVDFPTVNINAKLPGADPVTMAATVSAPLERRLGQIAGVSELTSISAQGNANITAQFDLSRDIEGAAHDVQAAINASGSDLPVDLPSPPTYRKVNPADSPILILAVTSDSISQARLYDACDSILAQRISQIPGVAQVTVGGADKPAVRVAIDPVALAGRGLTLDDVRGMLTAANVNLPKGNFEDEKQSAIIDSNDRLTRAEQFAPLLLRAGDDSVLRLSDVATVTDGTENSKQGGWFNLGKAVILIIQKQPDANVIHTVDGIQAILPRLAEWMPVGTKIHTLIDRTQTIRASVADVEFTLLLSVLLVIGVVYLALGRVTPTLAVSVTVPLSLAGTFVAMWLLGYTLDNISLMALTISVGFVVDDAIVMIENISRHVEEGETPLQAAVRGARAITSTMLSISISLIAVFIPLLFMGGIIGRLFREFSVTLSIAIAVSLLVSLTVTPTLYGHLMTWRHRNDASPNRGEAGRGAQERDGGASHALTPTLSLREREHMGERMFGWLQLRYERGLGWALGHQATMLGVMLAALGLTVLLYIWIPKGFFPQQDTGMLIGTVEGRSDISFAAMQERHLEAMKIVLDDPSVAALGGSVGTGGGSTSGNQGRLFISLKPLKERGVGAEQVIARLRPKLAKIQGVSVFLQAAQDIRVGGRAGKAQFQFALWDESLEELREWTPRLIERLKKEPGLTDVSSDQDAAAQELDIVVDRDAAARLGVDMQNVDQALQNAFSQRQVSNIYGPRNQYHVVMEVQAPYRQDESALQSVYVGSAGGAPVPLSAIARVERGLAPVSVMHQGQFPAATLSFNLPAGASLGDAAARIEQASREIGLPPTLRSGFAGNAKAFADSVKGQPVLILASILVIYIVLGVLYESLLHPITILSTLPSAGVGALLALMLASRVTDSNNFDLSLIGLIGVILLMGIVKKNGIILVDFAIEAERRGLTPQDAIRQACGKRFRPILMTTLAAVLGALPLIVTGGNGAELRQPLGVAIVGGLLLSQALTLFTTPVVYLAMEEFRRWIRTLPPLWRAAAFTFIVALGVLLPILLISLWLTLRQRPRTLQGVPA